MSKFSHLFSPIKVGNFEYRNRFEAAPTLFAGVGIYGFTQMGFKLPVDHTFRMIEDRAKGGCASVVIGEIGVNSQESKRLPFEPDVDFSNLNDPSFVSFQRYAQVMKNPGASSWVSSLDRKFIVLAWSIPRYANRFTSFYGL